MKQLLRECGQTGTSVCLKSDYPTEVTANILKQAIGT